MAVASIGDRSTQQDEIVMLISEFNSFDQSQFESRFSLYGQDCVARLHKCQLLLRNGSTKLQQTFMIQDRSSKGASQQEMTVMAMDGKLWIRFGKKQTINTGYSESVVNKWAVMTAIGAFGICVFLLYKRRILHDRMKALESTVQSHIETVRNQSLRIGQQRSLIETQASRIQQLEQGLKANKSRISEIWAALSSFIFTSD